MTMNRRHWFGVFAAGFLLAACAPPPPESDAPSAQLAAAQLACEPSPRMPVEGRASPYDSVTFQVGGSAAKICYGRPAARGRTMIGGDAVPFGRIWRTGANEPTILHLSGPVDFAGMALQAGSYSIYTIPTAGDWTVIVNRATEQWGHESQYTEAIQAQELGRATVRSEQIDDHVESFTIRPVARGNDVDLLLEWERTRVTIPVRAAR
jgi:hypothetical protein